MKTLHFISFICLGLTQSLAAAEKPNFVVIFTDDQGYADLGCFGGEHVSTPRIDQMAAEGSRLTSFYVAGSVCTPSRGALMTGCYPKRIGLASGVFLAGDKRGLNPEEITIAEALAPLGYVSGHFGKWHVGDIVNEEDSSNIMPPGLAGFIDAGGGALSVTALNDSSITANAVAASISSTSSPAMACTAAMPAARRADPRIRARGEIALPATTWREAGFGDDEAA